MMGSRYAGNWMGQAVTICDNIDKMQLLKKWVAFEFLTYH